MNMGQKREEKKREVVITNRNVVVVDSGIRITRYRKRKKKRITKTDLWMKKVVNLKEIRRGVMRL